MSTTTLTSAAATRAAPAPATGLHIAVDCRVVGPHFPGIGRATLETVRALAAGGQARCLSLLVARDAAPAELVLLREASGGRVRLVELSAGLRTPADQWTLPRLLARLRPDVYHATYYAVPLALSGRVVVTLYDLIPRLFPRYWPNPVVRGIIDGWTGYALRRATRIIACSHSTASDVARLLPAVAPRVRVAPLGVTLPARGHAEARPAVSTAPYLLYVGSNKPHKNLPRLVAAFARLAPDTPGSLVIAGAWDPRYPQAVEAARRQRLQDRVVFEHAPSGSRLDELYAGASGFVFPSRYEGFGLPVLEAMAAGLPVATTGRGALAEVAGDAALLFEPDDEDAMAAAMRRLLRDESLRIRLVAAGTARAALFPWSRTARDTYAVYEEAACA